MNKDRAIRTFVNLSIIIGILLLVSQLIYFNNLPNEFYGEVEATIFNVSFTNYQGTLTSFNMMLVTLLVVFVLNVVVAFLVGKTEDVENKYLKEVIIYNILITFMMIISQIVFVLLIPDLVNGVIANKFIYIEFPRLSSDIVKAFNLNFVLIILLIGYNMFVSIKSIPEREIVEVLDEELYEDAFFESLNQEEEK